jgi:hypothetical protein
MKLRIGTVTITGPRHYHFAGYETASWWTDYAIPGGTYDVLLTDHDDLYAIVPGTVIRSHFVNRLYWASSPVDDKDVGTTRDVFLPISPTDPGLALDDGWTVDRDHRPLADRPDYVSPLLSFGGTPSHLVCFLLRSYPGALTPAAVADRDHLADRLGLRGPDGRISVPA